MKERIISAFVLGLIFIPILWIGDLPFMWLIVGIGMLSTYELLHVRSEKKPFPILPYLFSYGWVGYFIINQSASTGLSFTLDYRMLILLMLSFFLPIILIADQKKYNIEDAFYLLGTILFLGISYHLLLLLRNVSLPYVIFLFLITIITDTFAYITGCMVGRHKLLESISPKKTIEGLIGGTLMATIIATIYYLEVISPTTPLIPLIIVEITLSLMGQFGDLVFSSIKRHFEKKDFSNLIPGHGGVLNRFDSIIFVCLTAAVLYFMI